MTESPLIAFGPEAPEFGSWEWIGADLSQSLRPRVRTITFRDHFPLCDVVVFVKFKPPSGELVKLRGRAKIVYVPVDIYGSAADIDGDAEALRCCDFVILHCERLRRYVSAYAPVEYVDHHLKFVSPLPSVRNLEGPLVWVGNQSNLPPVVEWVNTQNLPGEVWVLTDLDADAHDPQSLGFASHNCVRIETWTPERHIEWAAQARAAFDVKGNDFRARHKPPTKAMDWIASGVPLAMNADSSSSEHLSTLGFFICPLEDRDRWLSESYWQETQTMGRRLRSTADLDHICQRWHQLLQRVVHSS